MFLDVFSLPIATATLTKINSNFSALVAPLQEKVLVDLKAASVKHVDDSGFRLGGKTQWLHVISDYKSTHYRVSPKRGNLLEGLSGVLV